MRATTLDLYISLLFKVAVLTEIVKYRLVCNKDSSQCCRQGVNICVKMLLDSFPEEALDKRETERIADRLTKM